MRLVDRGPACDGPGVRWTLTERRTLVACLFLSAAILVGPRQWPSVVLSLVLAVAAAVWNHVRTQREAEAQAPPPAAGDGPASEA